MKKSFIIIVPIIIGCLLVFTHTFGFFSNSGQSATNTFAASAIFPTATPTITPTPSPTSIPTPTPTTSQHMVVNEVFTNGGNSGSDWKGQYVELYNQSSSPIDINGWTINDVSGSNTISTPSAIPGNRFVVLVGNLYNGPAVPSSAIKIILGEQKFGSQGFATGGDFAQLKNGTTIIDQMSYGTNTAVFASPPVAPSSTQTAHRSPNGVDTDAATNWVTNTSTSIGTSNP